jgi:murein DD-endopeptidase MepM/ murein hydrolase activator NlpD
VTGSGGYGNHILVDTDDGEQYLIAHLESFNPDRSFTINKEDNLGAKSSKVETGEFIGYLGGSRTLKRDDSSSDEKYIVDPDHGWPPHLHFEVTSRSFKDPIGLFGIKKDDFKTNDAYSGDFKDKKRT